MEGAGFAPDRLAARVNRAAAAVAVALRRHPTLFASAFLLLYAYKIEDFSDFAQITANPFVTHPDATRQFLHSSPLTLFFGWPLTHLAGAPASFTVVCGAGFGLLLFALRRYLDGRKAEERSTILFVAFSTPLLLVLTQWVGKQDPYLISFYLLVVASRDNAWASGLFSLLLVLCHKELGTVMLAGDCLLRWSISPGIVLGAVLGNALVSLYLGSLSTPPLSRTGLALRYMQDGFTGWVANPVGHVLFGFNWFWLVLAAGRNALPWSRVVLFLVLCFAIGFDGADFTRDILLCGLPLVVYTAERLAAAPEGSRVARGRLPLLFLLQVQIVSFDQLRDTNWPHRLDWMARHARL